MQGMARASGAFFVAAGGEVMRCATGAALTTTLMGEETCGDEDASSAGFGPLAPRAKPSAALPRAVLPRAGQHDDRLE